MATFNIIKFVDWKECSQCAFYGPSDENFCKSTKSKDKSKIYYRGKCKFCEKIERDLKTVTNDYNVIEEIYKKNTNNSESRMNYENAMEKINKLKNDLNNRITGLSISAPHNKFSSNEDIKEYNNNPTYINEGYAAILDEKIRDLKNERDQTSYLSGKVNDLDILTRQCNFRIIQLENMVNTLKSENKKLISEITKLNLKQENTIKEEKISENKTNFLPYPFNTEHYLKLLTSPSSKIDYEKRTITLIYPIPTDNLNRVEIPPYKSIINDPINGKFYRTITYFLDENE